MKKLDGRFIVYYDTSAVPRGWSMAFVVSMDMDGYEEDAVIPSMHTDGLNRIFDTKEELIMKILSIYPEADISTGISNSIVTPWILFERICVPFRNMKTITVNGRFCNEET